MKKTKYIQTIFILLTSMIASVSCNSDGDEWIQNNANSSLKIRACIADTRSVVTGTEFKKGDKIGVYTIYNKNGISIGGANEIPDNSLNIAAQYDGTDWLFDENIKLYNNLAYVYAYYPFHATTKATAPSGLEIPVINVDISPDIKNEQTDYMYGVSNNVNANNTTADIQFKHALARITLSILKGTNDVGDGLISKVCLKNNTKVQTISTKGWIRLNGETGTKSNIEDALVLKTNVTINEKEAQNIDLLVFPATGKRGTELIVNVTESVEIVLTIDGQDYSFPISGMTWLGGRQYTYPITIDRKTSHTVVVDKVDLGFKGDNGKILYWASYNLGATSPEDYGGLYGWGDPTGSHTEQNEKNDYGNYLPDLNECLDIYGGRNRPASICGTELDIARKMWKGGWRLPSSNEFWKLESDCNITKDQVNGVEGIRITSKKNGNSIFLPKAPYRLGNKVLNSSSTHYWTGSATNNEEYPHYAATYYFGFSYSNPDEISSWPSIGNFPYYGYPIRPVTEE